LDLSRSIIEIAHSIAGFGDPNHCQFSYLYLGRFDRVKVRFCEIINYLSLIESYPTGG
jgi:hypothetical protein